MKILPLRYSKGTSMFNITDPATSETLVIETITIDLQGSIDTELGKNPCVSRYRCDEEAQQIWPINFSLNLHGYIEVKNEGRLRVSANGKYTIEKGGEPENMGGFFVRLDREATNEKMGGHVQHDKIAKMIRESAKKLNTPARKALIEAINREAKKEEVASSAHAARARVAKMIAAQLKQR